VKVEGLGNRAMWREGRTRERGAGEGQVFGQGDLQGEGLYELCCGVLEAEEERVAGWGYCRRSNTKFHMGILENFQVGNQIGI
jgi:hypothetical protein